MWRQPTENRPVIHPGAGARPGAIHARPGAVLVQVPSTPVLDATLLGSFCRKNSALNEVHGAPRLPRRQLLCRR